MGDEHAADQPAAGSHGTSPLDDPLVLGPLRAQMYKFALLQLADSEQAEDAVQDALVGALRNVAAFKSKSAYRTWVFGILKHKIADAFRQRQRFADVATLMSSDEEDEDFSGLFDSKGYWMVSERPTDWGQPEEVLRDQQFWRVFEICLDGMPAKQGRVFMMREFIGLDSDEICQGTGMSISNLHVTLHRARMRLRECLENRWFESAGET